jgi:hypothetical protein
MKETSRQSLNEVINDLIEDARSWYRLPKPIVEVLDRDRKQRKTHDLRDYLVNLLLEREATRFVSHEKLKSIYATHFKVLRGVYTLSGAVGRADRGEAGRPPTL